MNLPQETEVCYNVSCANIPVNLAHLDPQEKRTANETQHYSSERHELFKNVSKKHLERKVKCAPNGGQNLSKLKLALFKAEMEMEKGAEL